MNDNSIDLIGKKVLVTGGASGIGAAISRVFALCGADVCINYLSSEKSANEFVGMLSDSSSGKIVAFRADVSKPDDVLALFGYMDSQLGPADVLINNAGIESINDAYLLDLNEWDRIMSVNLRGAFHASQQAFNRMSNKGGVIINISSIHDKVPRKGLVHYCASKAAMNMMSRCLALEWAEHGIRVLSVSPGAIETEMNRAEIEEFGREKFNAWIPAGRVGQTDDVAWSCAFLASKKASYITGTDLYIDGAYKESTIPYDPRPSKQITQS